MNTLCTANQQLTLATTVILSRGQLTKETAGVSRWKMLGKVITTEGKESESFYHFLTLQSLARWLVGGSFLRCRFRMN